MLDLTIFIVGMILLFEVESSTDKIYSEMGQTLEQNRMWHKRDALYLAILAMIIIYRYFGITLESLLAFSYIGTLRMTYFNIRLNMRRGKPIFYLGENGWDGYFKKWTNVYYIVAISLVISNVLILYFYDAIF